MAALPTAQARLTVQPLEARDVPSGGLAALPSARYAVGSGEGSAAQVNVYHAQTGALVGIINPFAPTATSGVRVAAGDLTGDGVDDIVAAGGAGDRGAVVKVFDGRTLDEVKAFDAGTGPGGAHVAVGDVTGDGRADLVVGAGAGKAVVKVYDGAALLRPGTPTAARTLTAFGREVSGVAVAVGDVDGDGRADVVTGAGPGGAARVKVYSGRTGAVVQSFTAVGRGFDGGLSVAAGDVDGDGKAEVIAAAGVGGSPDVKVYKAGRLTATVRADDPTDRRGVRVAARDVDGDGKAEIIAAAGPGGAPKVQVLTAAGKTVRSFPGFMSSYRGGLYVG